MSLVTHPGLLQVVSLNQTQVVIGLANGWAGSYSNLLIYPQSVGEAWATLAQQNIVPRGIYNCIFLLAVLLVSLSCLC